MKKFFALLICVSMVFAFFTGCEKKTTIYVYNVGDYIDEEVIKLFEKEYPEINVNYETYYTNEEMHAKVKAGRTAYDVVFPSDYMVERMIDEDMLLPIDFDNVPNYKNIGDEFKGLCLAVHQTVELLNRGAAAVDAGAHIAQQRVAGDDPRADQAVQTKGVDHTVVGEAVVLDNDLL